MVKIAKLKAREGYIMCPECGAKLQRVLPSTKTTDLPVYCRKCKLEVLVNIDCVSEAFSPEPQLVEPYEA